MSDELLSDPIASLFGQHLRLLRQLTGLPVVVGGTTSVGSNGAQQLVISHLWGTITDALFGLVVPTGRGLGGMAIARARPCVVNDYASSRAITHHYDRQVVKCEKVTSAFAVPIHAGGRVVGVLGGGCRDEFAIGDVPLRRAEGVAYKLGKDIADSLGASAAPAQTRRTATGEALTDILAVARHVTDPDLRARLERAHRALACSGASLVAPPRAVVLAPRELDSLRLAAVGASNAEIAADLGLSTTTVKAYLRSAMRKLDVHNRTAATHAARIAGLI